MTVFARPLPTKLAAALLATGIATTGAVVDVSDARARSPITAEVANASVITDALYNLGDVVSGLAAGITVPANALIGLPFDAATAVLVASQSPSLAPSLFSWLIQRYTNPSDTYPYFTYPWDFKVDAIEPIIEALLPPALAAQVIARINQLATSISDALKALPDPFPGAVALSMFWSTALGGTFVAAELALNSPVSVLSTLVDYVAYLPADLEATVESAIRNPSQIPGLVSYLADGLLGSSGLLGNLVWDATYPLTWLPDPIGQAAHEFNVSVWDGLDNLLSLLPPPIAPTPFANATVDAAVTSVAPEVDSFAARTTGEESPESTSDEGSSVSTDSAAEEEDSSAAEEDLLSSNGFQAGDEKSAVEDEAAVDGDATDPSESGDAADKDDETAGDPAGESADEAGAEKSADTAA